MEILVIDWLECLIRWFHESTKICYFFFLYRYNFILYPKYKKKCRNNFKIRENRTCSFGVWSDELNIYLYIYFFSYLDQIRHCIIFHRIGEGDSGVYSCQAVNPLGEAVCEAEFQIVPGEGIFKIFISSFLLKKYTIIIFFDNKKLRWRRRRRWPLHSRKMENRK